jgi:16S rRNA processing protein RimM
LNKNQESAIRKRRLGIKKPEIEKLEIEKPEVAEDFITLAWVLKTQGRRGEVAVEVHSDIPDRLRENLRLFALAPDNTRRQLQVEEVWPHKEHLILKFRGVDSISAAEALIGCELQVPRGERARLEAGWTYVSDLVGCIVFDAGREIGRIEDVKFGAGEAPLLMVKAGMKIHEIPYAEAYLKSVDLVHKQIQMQLPEGMLDLNAPLTADEKEQQRASGKAERRK